MKYAIIAIAALMLLFGAALADESGTFGEGLTWQIDGDTLTISGEGAMPDYETYEDQPWRGENVIRRVVITDGVTAIGAYAFNWVSMTDVAIPSSVTQIGAHAFEHCQSLTEVFIPDSVTAIGDDAFAYCCSLTDISCTPNVTDFGTNVFLYCTALTDISIPFGFEKINMSTFSHCTALTHVTIPDSVWKIEPAAFDGCASLTDVVLPASITMIQQRAFGGCTSLTEIILPERVSYVEYGAFNGAAKLTGVTVLNSNAYFGAGALTGISDQAVIRGYAGSTAQTYAEQNGMTFAAIGPTPQPTVEPTPEPAPEPDLVLPDQLMTIEDEAFSGIAARAVLIPAGVTAIEGDPFADSGVRYIYGDSDVARRFAEAHGYEYITVQ